MNSRILLIAFATISYLGVTNSARLDPQSKDVQPQVSIVPSSPVTNHTETLSQIPTKSVSPVAQNISKPEIVESNKTNVKIEVYNATTETPKPSSESTTKPNNTTTSASIPTQPSSASTNNATNHTTPTTTKTTVPVTSEGTTTSSPQTESTKGSTGGFESTTPRGISGPGRQFDGPSFIGGIVLTVGLTAIGFIAFKFYKAGKLDMNYRTL